MKPKIVALALLVSGALSFSSCHNALDITPKDKLFDEQLWKDQSLVLLYTNNFYAQLTSGFNGTISNGWLLSSITDDAISPASSTVATAARGVATYNYDASSSPLNTNWNNRYNYIRRANVYLSKIDNVPGDPTINRRLKAEIRFLRAYYYYDLVQWFGAVPIITVAQDYDDPALFPTKNTLDECYDFIMTELDNAANDLPATYPASDLGRITKQAALGLKCRVQMLRKDWPGAAVSAKAIMDLGVNSLIKNASNPQAGYTSVFTTANNAEMILSVQHDNNKDQRGTQFDLNTLSPVYGGSGSNCPTQNLVDEYEIKTTGKLFSEIGSGYDATKPYLNRDPRFDATILYDGVTFKGRVMQMYTGGQDVTPNTSLGVTSEKITPTGYYLKKFTNESTNILDANVRSSYNWPIIRYAEVLLNYAESQNEAVGPDAEVYKAVNAVRNRVNMPNLPDGLSQDQMRIAIRHERRVELAFEDARYWDVKRWKQAESLFSSATTPIRKVTIALNASTGVKTYTYSNVAGYTRTFLEKHYLFPIPKTEIDKPGNKLLQNKDW